MSRRWRIVLAAIGMALIVISIVILAYATWPYAAWPAGANILRERYPIAPTVFVPPPAS